MANRFKAAVFDLDGTLLDTSDGLSTAVKYTIDHFGLSPLSDEQIRTFIGPPIKDSFARTYDPDEALLNEMVAVFRDRYKTEDLLKAVPYDGIYEVLAKLKDAGIKPAIATYKRQDYATMILEHFHFNDYTDIMCGSDFDSKLRKHDIIRNAVTAAGINDYSQAVMIGDSDNDAVGAEKTGMLFIGVTYGFGFRSAEDVNKYSNIGTADLPEQIMKIITGEKI